MIEDYLLDNVKERGIVVIIMKYKKEMENVKEVKQNYDILIKTTLWTTLIVYIYILYSISV